MKLPKEKTYKQLLKELDSYYSKYIRQKDADSEGYVACYTCGAVKHWKSIDCGHYISRRHLSSRFFEKNTKPQCKGCNIFKEGNKPVFALELIKEYGKDVLEELDSLSHIKMKYDRNRLSNMIMFYKKKGD